MTLKYNTHIKTITFLLISACYNTALAEDIEVLHYGIFAHSPDNGKSWINPISDKIVKGKSASPVHIKSSRKIPAKYPLFFGFEYYIKNIKESVIEVTTEVTHPKIKLSENNYQNNYQETNKFLVIDGKINASNGYLLENKNEITPGEWSFKIKIGDKTIITQNFEVID